MLVPLESYKDIFNKLNSNYIVQKRSVQSSETAAFNPSSVNTEKVVSFLYKGEVYILSSIMCVGAENAITDAAASGKGYFF